MNDLLTQPLIWVVAAAIIIFVTGIGIWLWQKNRGTKNADESIRPQRSSAIKTNAKQTGSDANESQEQRETGKTDEKIADGDTDIEDRQTGAQLDTVEPVSSRMVRLRSRLANGSGLSKALLNVLSKDEISSRDWEEIEDTLLLADLGIESSEKIITELKTAQRVHGIGQVDKLQELLRETLLRLVDEGMDRSLHLEKTDKDGVQVPAVVLMVGVNGTGKTTTVGKLARILVSEERSVLLGAADTFRAAAAEQLQTWGERVGVPVVASDKEGADPASVAFESIKTGIAENRDVVVVDTAGRLQNKAGLMDELGKVKRVIEKQAPVSESLLVLDATTGQNGMKQAEVFAQVADITGIVLTKMDGSAKGGIVLTVQREIGVPVKLVGLGEGPDDLVPFDSLSFVDGLIS